MKNLNGLAAAMQSARLHASTAQEDLDMFYKEWQESGAVQVCDDPHAEPSEAVIDEIHHFGRPSIGARAILTKLALASRKERDA